jgi:ArsR family transcriptional regulator, arsenate/arsenite/antimonite-responsive transcriptional repressor
MARSNKTVRLEVLFAALADRTRLRLLNLIRKQEICVCYFVEVLGDPQPKISRHLAYLRRAGIVAARREGKWMHYRLAVPAESAAGAILRTTLAELNNDKEAQADFARLNRACQGAHSLVHIIGAPPPSESDVSPP